MRNNLLAKELVTKWGMSLIVILLETKERTDVVVNVLQSFGAHITRWYLNMYDIEGLLGLQCPSLSYLISPETNTSKTCSNSVLSN